MAQTKIVTVLDDLDGSEGARPVRFALDGTRYEIDLSEANEQRLRDIIAPYAAAARRAGRQAAAALPQRRRLDRARSAEMRAYAVANGFKVGQRGRLPARAVADYNACHG